MAAMPAGSLVGALAVTQLADRIGRKKTIILSGLIWVIGSTLQSASIVCFLFPPLESYNKFINLYFRIVICS